MLNPHQDFLLPKLGSSVADPGCLSRIRLFSIPDPGSELFPSWIRIKEFKYFNPKKWFLSSRKYDPGCSSRVPDPDADFLPIPDPGSKRHRIPDPQHCLVVGIKFISGSEDTWMPIDLAGSLLIPSLLDPSTLKLNPEALTRVNPNPILSQSRSGTLFKRICTILSRN